jgi:hypothetical protein
MPSTFKAPCAIPTCPHRKPCPVHGRPADRDRGTARQRGYDTAHDREAEAVKAQAIAERRPCPRCGEPMLAGQDLDAGHSIDRVRSPGARADRVEHASCNRSAGGKLAHR